VGEIVAPATTASLQARTVRTLMAANAVGSGAVASTVATIGLAAAEVLGGDAFAGLPVATISIGSALAAPALARMMGSRGRRPGLAAGYLAGTVGAAGVVWSAGAEAFPILLLALLAFGAGQASNYQARFVAGDLAEPGRRGRDIAAVVWLGAIGAILAPLLGPWEQEMGESLGLGTYLGPVLVSVALFAGAGLIIFWRLRPDPLAVLGLAGRRERAPARHPVSDLLAAWRIDGARLALVALFASQVVMVAVMAMTPAHMRDHGQAELSYFVIAAHIAGMFGLAPLVGRWSDRWGQVRAIAFGGSIIAAGTVASVAAGYVPALLFVGLFLLGLGWSFCLIAASALLVAAVPPELRVGVQGGADLLLGLGAAAAGLASGLIKEAAGFHWLANLASLAAAALVVYAVRAARSPDPAV
jgi:MFS family permease